MGCSGLQGSGLEVLPGWTQAYSLPVPMEGHVSGSCISLGTMTAFGLAPGLEGAES